MWNDGSLPFAVGNSDLDLHDLATDDEQNSTRKRTVDASFSPATKVPPDQQQQSSFMSTSSSESDRDPFDPNGDLPFDMELAGLNLSESPRSAVSPWKPRDASAWAVSQGLIGRYAKFLRRPTCFDLAPESGKLVVLDESLSVQLAFQALRENGIKSAPLWSTDLREFIGMVSVSDFVEILLSARAKAIAEAGPAQDPIVCDAALHKLLQRPLSEWREILKPRIPHLVFVSPEDSVLEASAAMLQHHIHRVAVLDPESHTLLYLMTHSVILTYLLASIHAQPTLGVAALGQSLADSGFMQDPEVTSPVNCCTLETPFFEVLRRFSQDMCSAVPLVDPAGRMISVVTKSDIRGIVRPGVWHALNQTVGELLMLRYRGKGPDISSRVILFQDSVEVAMSKLSSKDVYRLFVLDGNMRVVGKITLTKLFRFLLALK